MSARWILIAGWVAVPVLAQERPADEVPARIEPPTAVQRVEDRAPARGQAMQPVPRRGRTAGRVIVRRGLDDPETILWRSQMRDFYLPHITHSPWDPYSSQWALEGMFLARDARDRENLRRLYNFRDMQERDRRLQSQHERAVAAGLERLRAGDYRGAVAPLALAAELDHGDPASRIHLAQARVALGAYAAAARDLRRALELQPKLVYLDLDLGSYLPDPGLVQSHADALRRHLAHASEPADVHFLLGFLRFQHGDLDAARRWFEVVARVRPKDDLATAYLGLTGGGRAVATVGRMQPGTGP